MNLGLAPMPEGYLHDNDILSLKAFGQKLKQTFSVNLAAQATAKASNVRGNNQRFGTTNLFDADRYSYYAADDSELQPELEIDLGSSQTFDLIRIRENIKLGQRLDSVAVYRWDGQGWQSLAKASSIGANRILKLAAPVTAQRLKVKLFAPVAPTLSEFALFKEADAVFASQTIDRKRVAKKELTLISADKQAHFALDDNLQTIWQSSLSRSKYIELRLAKTQLISGLQYVPRQDGKLQGIPTKYKLYTSVDGKQWELMASGEFSNIKANATVQTIAFPKAVEAHYIRFEPLEILSGDKQFSVAEFDLLMN